MWPNPQETADLVNLLKKSLMENFIFCAVNGSLRTVECFKMLPKFRD